MDKQSLDGLALLHDLVPFLPIDRLHAILNTAPLPVTAEGAALFADISGFTTLAEQLKAELGAERGSEELNTQANYIFAGLIDAIDRYHGSVLRFSGDGVMAWFTGEEYALRAATAGLAMQAVMQATTAVLPGLRLKVGVGSGPTRRFLPGNPATGVYEVLTGQAVTHMGCAEKHASPGDVIICPHTVALVGESLAQETIAEGYARLQPTIFAPTPESAVRWPSIRWLDHLDRAWDLVEVCRAFIPISIYQRLQAGHGAYMNDSRLVAPLFMRFTGIDYTAPDSAAKLDDLVRTAQEVVTQHGGTLNEVEIGDKGNVLVALFGAPDAQVNPAQQAAYAALALEASLPHVDTLHNGLTSGQLFAGTVGSPMRRAYAVIGDEVNLAARLMMRAAPGELLANHAAQQAAEDFAWQPLEPIRVKGKAAPVRVYRLGSHSADTKPLWPAGAFIARTEELEMLKRTLQAAPTRRRYTVILTGEPGMGKSHLLREFGTVLRQHGINVLHAASRSIEQHTPYRIWRDIFSTYFDLGILDKKAPPEARRSQVENYVRLMIPEALDQVPLLNDVLQLGIPENDFTQPLEPAQRHSALVNLLLDLLRAWLEEDALAIVLDNAQWMDSLSWDLAFRAAQQLNNHPLILLLAMRHIADEPPPSLLPLLGSPRTHRVALKPLDDENAAQLAAYELGGAALPETVNNLIMQNTGGNPLFIKEVVAMLQDGGLVAVEDGEAKLLGQTDQLQIPSTVQATVATRIDRLPPDQQVLLKTAAVIGPQFHYATLRDIQPLRISEDALRDNLTALETIGIEHASGSDDDSIFSFRYAVTREVAYGLLSFYQRRGIHRAVAQWYEHEYNDNLAPYYPLLTHHWKLAEDRAKERGYAYLAGKQAAAQYANTTATNHFERALELTDAQDDARLYDILTRLETLYHLHGARSKQVTVLSALSLVAAEKSDLTWQAETHILWARYYESIAEYESAIEAAEQAFAAAEQAEASHLKSISSIYYGLALMRTAHYSEAVQQLSQGFEASDNSVEAWGLDILGQTYNKLGEYGYAQATYEAALEKAQAVPARETIGRIYNHMGSNAADMGRYEEALMFYEQARQTHEEIGNRQGVATAFNNLGQLALEIGDYENAHNYLNNTHEIFREIGDRNNEAATLNHLGKLAYERGDIEAARAPLEHALYIQRRIGDKRGTAFSLVNLALLEVEHGNWHEAEMKIGEAMAIDAALDREFKPIIAFVGSAIMGLMAMLHGNSSAALAQIQIVLDSVEAHGLEKCAFCLQVGLISYEVLSHCGDEENARRILTEAHRILIKRADRITDPERRARYLLTVPTHRGILDLHKQVFR